MRNMLLAVVGLAFSGCLPGTSETAFLGGRAETNCSGTYPVCKGKFAGCRLDDQHFVTGNFPGSRKLLVETAPGDWIIRVKIFLSDQLSPGTETEVSWYEPGCADQYRYQLTKEAFADDLFEKAGRDQVFEVEQGMAQPGDHLIEVYSDSTCRYALRIEAIRQEN
ncbi:MAG: hypothetical protein V1754_11295 [Pseudomonadota bacterium]